MTGSTAQPPRSAAAGGSANSDELAHVRCFLPGSDAAVAEAHVPPGPHSLADLQEALDLRSPLVGLLPRPKVVPAEPASVQRASERANAQFRLAAKGKGQATPPSAVTLEAGVRYTAVLGAAPLIRFTTGTDSRPHVCEEGLWVLRQLPAPVHVAVIVGLGRCGKSTTCSALARTAWKEEEPGLDRFVVGHSPKPVTAGADVTALPSASGEGCLLLIDCEGNDNAHADNQVHCRTLATLAFAVASHVSLCGEGLRLTEGTIEFLGSAVAARQMIRTSAGLEGASNRYWPHLCFLMMQSDYAWTAEDLVGALEEREGQDSRNENCLAIQEAFGAEPNVRSLPRGVGTQAYTSAISELHGHLCQSCSSSAGLQLSGSQLAEVMSRLCEEVSAHGGYMAPDSAYARVVRQHVQAVVDSCVDEYQKCFPVLEGYREESALQAMAGNGSAAMAGALACFDEQTGHITSGIRGQMRILMEGQIQQMFDDLLSTNAGFREAEERQAYSNVAVLTDAFARLLPARIDGRLAVAVTEQKWADLRRWESEQLLAFDAHTSGFCCRSAATTAKKDLAGKLTELLEALQVEDRALRAASEAAVQAAVDVCLRRLAELPEAEHYNPELSASFDTFRREALASFQQQVSECADRGDWEAILCKEQLRGLHQQFDAALATSHQRNDGIRVAAEEQIEVAAKVSLDRVLRLPKSQHYEPNLVDSFHIVRDDALSGFRRDVSSIVGKWEGALCTERMEQLRGRFDLVLEGSRQTNESLKAAAEATVRDAMESGLNSLDGLPDVQHYQPKLAVSFRAFIVETLSGFDAEVADVAARGEWEERLCRERCGELRGRLDAASCDLLKRNDLLRQLRQRSQMLTLVAIAALVLLVVSATFPEKARVLWHSPMDSFEWPQPPPREWPTEEQPKVTFGEVAEMSCGSLCSLDSARCTLENSSVLASEVSKGLLDSSKSDIATAGGQELLEIAEADVATVAAEPESLATSEADVGNLDAPSADASGAAAETGPGQASSADDASSTSGTWASWRRSVGSHWRGGAHWRDGFRQSGRRLLSQDASTPLLVAFIGAAMIGIRAELGGFR